MRNNHRLLFAAGESVWCIPYAFQMSPEVPIELILEENVYDDTLHSVRARVNGQLDDWYIHPDNIWHKPEHVFVAMRLKIELANLRAQDSA